MQRLWWQGCARFIHDRGELDLLVVAVVQICQPDGLCCKDYQGQGYARIISSMVVQGLSAAGGCEDYYQQGCTRIISGRGMQGLLAAGCTRIFSSMGMQGLLAAGAEQGSSAAWGCKDY